VFLGHVGNRATRFVGIQLGHVGIGDGVHGWGKFRWIFADENSGVKGYGGGLAETERVEASANLSVACREAGGGKEGGVDLTGFPGGKKGARGGGAELAEEGEGFGGGGRVGNEERGNGSSYFPGKVG